MNLMTGRALSGTSTRIAAARFETLTAALGERLILPGAPGYDEARRVWNGMIDKRPAAIARCRGAADVIRCVQFARDHQVLVAVRGGAHNVAGFATCDGGLVIDLTLMRGISVDPRQRTARAQPGVTWGDLDRETQVFGLAVPGGIVSTTGVAGLTLGGGQGWLRRTYGMSCDSLISADVITADGELLTASETAHADLFWALRGGGGNFGIVTEFEFRVHPIGPIVAFAAPVYAIERAPAVLAGFRAFVAAACDEVNATATLWTIPADPAFPSSLHGRNVVTLAAIYAGEPARGERVLQPLRAIDQPLFDMSSRLPYTDLQSLFDRFFPKGELRYYWKGICVDSLNDDVVAKIAAAANDRPSSLSMVAVWALGGAMGRVGPQETAVGSRDAPFLVEMLANWKEPRCTEPNIAWAARTFEALRRLSSGKPNFNFPGLAEDTKDFVRAAFGPNYPRLVAVTSVRYIESSALVDALLERDADALKSVRTRGPMVTSALTIAETARAFLRARTAAQLTADQEGPAVRALRRFERRCFVVAVTTAVLSRARRPFPSNRFARSLRCILRQSSCLANRPPLVSVATRDVRVRENALALGYVVE